MSCPRLRAAAIVLALTAEPALAQSPATGLVTGRVLDPTGLPLAGVIISATGAVSKDARSTQTTSSGDYSLAGLLPTDYLMSFELAGFHAEQRRVRIISSVTVALDVTLNVEAVPETVRVTSETQAAEPQHSMLGGPVLKTDMLDRLPIETLFENRVTLAAGVTANGPGGAITISGALSYGNLFLIDGFVINENLGGLSRPFLLPDATQETRIAVSNIPAEYRTLSGRGHQHGDPDRREQDQRHLPCLVLQRPLARPDAASPRRQAQPQHAGGRCHARRSLAARPHLLLRGRTVPAQ